MFRRYCLTCVVIAFVFCSAALAKPPGAILRAMYSPGSDSLEVMFDQKIDSAGTLLLKDRVYLVDYANGNIKPATFEVKRSNLLITGVFATLGIAGDPSAIFQRDPKFLVKNPIGIQVLVSGDAENPPKAIVSSIVAATTVPPTELGVVGTSKRDSADTYLSGESVKAVGSKPVFSLDVKYEKPFTEYRKVNIGPYLSYKGSTNPKADPDQLKLGLRFAGFIWKSNKLDETTNRVKPCKSLICRVEWEVGPEFESNRQFTVKNLLVVGRVVFPLRTGYFRGSADDGSATALRDSLRIWVRPYIGAEIGRNLRSPIVRDEKSISRLLGGVSINLEFPSAGLSWLGIKKGITWETDFTERWFLSPEFAYQKTDNKLVLTSFGKGPRPHFVTKLNFQFNDAFGPSLSYEWGDEPPLYNRVRHQVKFGFTFAVKRKTAK